MDGAIMSMALSAATQGGTAFSNFLPSFSEIRKADPLTDPSVAGDVRMGEVAAITLTVGVGLIASSLTKSPIPAVTAFVMCLILVALYEYALTANRPFERKNDDA